MSTNGDGVFAQALRDSRDISEDYYDDEKLRQQWSDSPEEFSSILDNVRELMETNGGIKKIAAVAPALQAKIETMHRDGRIGAVDGTDAIAPTEVTSRTVYAAAVISATMQTLHDPRIRMTASDNKMPSQISNTGGSASLLEFIEKLERYATDLSWVRTFREHQERAEALRLLVKNLCDIVLIDGPLYTQNLLSQPDVRESLLKEMLAHPSAVIGFIKNMQTAKLLHLAGMALRPGEYWTVEKWRQLLEHRFNTSLQSTKDWLGKQPDWIRCVYRKNDKAFAFECHPSLVETGIALVNSPVTCCENVNHELPFLLEAVDRIVRAQTNANAKSINLIASSPNFANLTSERSFRR
jgi:hypothetical protein